MIDVPEYNKTFLDLESRPWFGLFGPDLLVGKVLIPEGYELDGERTSLEAQYPHPAGNKFHIFIKKASPRDEPRGEWRRE